MVFCPYILISGSLRDKLNAVYLAMTYLFRMLFALSFLRYNYYRSNVFCSVQYRVVMLQYIIIIWLAYSTSGEKNFGEFVQRRGYGYIMIILPVEGSALQFFVMLSQSSHYSRVIAFVTTSLCHIPRRQTELLQLFGKSLVIKLRIQHRRR